MSLGIVIKCPEGVVLAAESRVTLVQQQGDGQEMTVNFDNATKLISFDPPNTSVGLVTYGTGAIGVRTAYSFLPEFEASLPPERLPMKDFAQRLSDFFAQQWKAIMPADFKGPDMTFVLAGFNTAEAYGRIFRFGIPNDPTPTEEGAPDDFGMTWGGQRDIVDRLMQGYDSSLPELVQRHFNADDQKLNTLLAQLRVLQLNVPIPAMALQDCVDLAIFLLRTTIAAQRLTVGVRGVGGPIDVAVITRQEGIKFVQRKRIVGEGTGVREFGMEVNPGP